MSRRIRAHSTKASAIRASSDLPRGDIGGTLHRNDMAWKVAGVNSTPADSGPSPSSTIVQVFETNVKHVSYLLNASGDKKLRGEF